VQKEKYVSEAGPKSYHIVSCAHLTKSDIPYFFFNSLAAERTKRGAFLQINEAIFADSVPKLIKL